MNSQTLIFQHVPKAGGTTLVSILNRLYPLDLTCDVSIERGTEISRFKSFPYDKRKNYKLIHGHGALRLFNYVDSPVVITMLRSPVDRVISFYHHKKNVERHNSAIANKYSLEDCFKKKIYIHYGGWGELVDGQTKQLLAMRHLRCAEAYEGTSDLEFLKSIVRRGVINVGITEQFDASIMLFKKLLGWKKNLFYYKKFVTINRPQYNTNLKHIIMEHNQKDMELYNFALDTFNKLLKMQDEDFHKQLKRFQRMNKFINALVEFYRKAGYYRLYRTPAISGQN